MLFKDGSIKECTRAEFEALPDDQKAEFLRQQIFLFEYLMVACGAHSTTQIVETAYAKLVKHAKDDLCGTKGWWDWKRHYTPTDDTLGYRLLQEFVSFKMEDNADLDKHITVFETKYDELVRAEPLAKLHDKVRAYLLLRSLPPSFAAFVEITIASMRRNMDNFTVREISDQAFSFYRRNDMDKAADTSTGKLAMLTFKART